MAEDQVVQETIEHENEDEVRIWTEILIQCLNFYHNVKTFISYF